MCLDQNCPLYAMLSMLRGVSFSAKFRKYIVHFEPIYCFQNKSHAGLKHFIFMKYYMKKTMQPLFLSQIPENKE